MERPDHPASPPTSAPALPPVDAAMWSLVDADTMAARLGITRDQFKGLKQSGRVLPVVISDRCHRYHPPSVVLRLLKTSAVYEPELAHFCS